MKKLIIDLFVILASVALAILSIYYFFRFPVLIIKWFELDPVNRDGYYSVILILQAIIVWIIWKFYKRGNRQNIMKILRWIAVPLVAMLFAYIASLAAELFARLNFTGVGNGNWLDMILYWLSKGLFEGAGVVYGGALVAPRNKGIVSVVISTLWTALCVIVICFTFSDLQWYKWVYYLSGIASSIFVSKYYVGLDKDKELFSKPVKPSVEYVKKTPLPKEDKDYDKIFSEYYNKGMAALQHKEQIDTDTVIKFLSSIGDRRKEYSSYANSRFIAERPYLPYMIFMRLPLTMEDEKDGQLYFTIKGINSINWKYNVEFDKEVSLIYKDDNKDNEMPKKLHILSSDQLEDIIHKKLVGTFLHYHC